MIRAAALLVLTALPALADPAQPAELPPPGYAGLQYVDSKGCMFVRAGTGGEVLWIPRVTRQGVPVCGNPPSGRRVPVVEEVGVQPVPDAAVGAATRAAARGASPAASEAATGSYFVAVGSFDAATTAERAEAKLGQMNYRSVRGRVQGGSSTLITVFAGPFADASEAEAARVALSDSGFPDAALIGP